MTTTTSTRTFSRRWAVLLLAVLAAVLALVLPASTASANGLSAAQTRVGVSTLAAPDVVGVAEHIAAGQRRSRAPSQLRLVSGHCVAAEDGGLLFRGVAKTHPGYEDALNGVAKPRGGLASAAEHNAGDTRSEFTSWTTDRSTAESFSYPGGVVLSVPKASVANRVFGSPDLYDEFEILIRGPVSGARVG